MSEMEVFVGRFKEAEDQTIFPKDTDDFYDLEIEHGQHYVKVAGTVYAFWMIPEMRLIDPYEFSKVIPPQDGPIVICYWYNGGAGMHEVVEEAIREYLYK